MAGEYNADNATGLTPTGSPTSPNDPGVAGWQQDLNGTSKLQPLPYDDTEDRRRRMKMYIDNLLGPIDYNDPAVKQLLLGAGNAAGASASNRGIGGPLSVNGIQQGVTMQLNATQMQRQQMGLAAQDMMNRNDLAGAELKMRQDQIAYDRWKAEQEQKFAEGAGVGQSVGSIYGGALGGVGGFLLSGGNPLVAAAGAQGGAMIGGGLGSQVGSHFSGGSYHYDPGTSTGSYTGSSKNSRGLGGF